MSEMDYPPEEKALKEKIDALNTKWEEACPENFVSYGFYPYYTKQKYRLLFVGREARGGDDIKKCGYDYIKFIYGNYISGDMLDGAFHHRIFYFSYGLLYDFPKCTDNEQLHKMRDTALVEFVRGGLSFAFMNISTIANETGCVYTRKEAYAKSEQEGRKFRKKMIEILAPDIIVCANCGEDISRLADNKCELEPRNETVVTDKLSFGTKSCLRFDTYHWSSFGKGRRNIDFYNNLCGSFRKFRHLIQAK